MIPVFKPLLGDAEKQAAAEVLEIGWLGMGANVQKFEAAVRDRCDLHLRSVVAVATGHAALHLALLQLKIGPGDEVITPSFNNVADFQAIKAVGAEIVFSDILDETLCVDPDSIERMISERTKAIIVMDYDCFLCDHTRIQEISGKYNIPVIHDAAHSFGSKYNGKYVGHQHAFTMYSFDPVKSFTCLDGGVLVSADKTLEPSLHRARLVGMGQPASIMYGNSRAWTYGVEELGFRYHMSNMHAAIGISQLEKFDIIQSSRQQSCKLYDSAFLGHKYVRTPNANYDDILPFLYYIRVPAHHRDDLIHYARAEGVDLGIHWQPGHSFGYFEECKRDDLKITEKVVSEIVSLPFHSCMDLKDQERVVSVIDSFFKN